MTCGCSYATKMATAERQYQQSVSQKVLILMDLDTLFADQPLRQLAAAAGKGRISTIDKLIEQGVDVNAQGTRKATALFWSMRSEKGFNHLLAKGANPNVVFGDGGSVMHWLARKSDCRMLKTALAHGGNPNLRAGLFGGSPAFETITVGKNKGVPTCFELLLANGADIEFKDDKGSTLLFVAADLARFDIALYLLDEGANPKVSGARNRSLRSVHDSFYDAFNEGSITEQNWFKFKQRLDEIGIN